MEWASLAAETRVRCLNGMVGDLSDDELAGSATWLFSSPSYTPDGMGEAPSDSPSCPRPPWYTGIIVEDENGCGGIGSSP